MKYRIFLRTLKFIAFYWSLPFFIGTVFTLSLVYWVQDDLLQSMDREFLQVIDAVVTQCAL